MKNGKRMLAAVLIVLMLVTAVPLTSLQASAYNVGDHIQFGSYPQTRVEETAALKKAAASAGWRSYRYYSGTGRFDDGNMKPDDYMKFADFFCGNTKYRAVTITKTRPYETYKPAGYYGNIYQSDAGYASYNSIYYFKYEPLSWRILDPSTGYVMCENVIDSQPYQNKIYFSTTDGCYWQNSKMSIYANSYATSSVHSWLNNIFYETAFTNEQKEIIQKTPLNNDAYAWSYYSDINESAIKKYNSQATNDKIFLLSCPEASNEAYGFSSSYDHYDDARVAHGTDYAKCQGLSVGKNNTPFWWLRSPGKYSDAACFANGGGVMGCTKDVYETFTGVRPACRLKALKNNPSISKDLFSGKGSSVKKPSIYALTVCGIGADSAADATNDVALYYSRLCDNRLSGYQTNDKNIHSFSYDSEKAPTTTDKLKKNIQNAFKESTEKDISFFTYSGHGKAGKNYGISLHYNTTWFKWKDLAQYLAENIKGKIIVFMDCCYSEGFINYGVKALSSTAQKRFTVFASSSVTEPTSIKDAVFIGKLIYSRFTYQCGQGLGFFDGNLKADADKNNIITAGELFDYVKTKVYAETINTDWPMNVKFYGNYYQDLFQFDPIVSLSKSSYVYDGKAKKPPVTVKTAAGKTVAAKNYSVSYKNNKKVGIATVTITLKGSYKGTRTLYFQILPAQVTGLTTGAVTETSIELKWNAVTGAKYYKVEQTTNKKTWKTIKTVSKNTATISGLKAGANYYYRVTAMDGTKTLSGKVSEILRTGTKTVAPTITLTSPAAKTVRVQWKGVPGAKSFIIYKSTDNKTWTEYRTVTKSNFSQVKNLTSGKKIYIKVVAVNAFGTKSAASAVKSIKVR